MKMQEYIDEIKLQLTGGVLNLELTDANLTSVVNSAFREVQRYIDTTRLVTVPFASCIDLKGFKASAIVKVYRSQGYNGDQTQDATLYTDPMYAAQWQLLSGSGNMYNLNDWVLNYAAWNTMLQMRNTTSTDMAFKEDKDAKKLYINAGYDKPANITIEYVPVFASVEDVTSDYWIDIIVRLSVALTKVILGRVRSRYTQSNALWTQDGATLLEEGNTELTDLREKLRVSSQLSYPID